MFFRDRCRRQALAIDVRGWVRNLPDGRVEVVAEGPPDALEALSDWCRQGPPHADVRSVEVIEEPAEGLSGFDVR